VNWRLILKKAKKMKMKMKYIESQPQE